jgi:hypothetical protein
MNLFQAVVKWVHDFRKNIYQMFCVKEKRRTFAASECVLSCLTVFRRFLKRRLGAEMRLFAVIGMFKVSVSPEYI